MLAQGYLSNFWIWAAGPNSFLKRERFNFFLLAPFSFLTFTGFCVKVVGLPALKVTWCLLFSVAFVCVTENEAFKPFYFCWMEKSLLWNWNGSPGICPHEWGMWQKKSGVNFALPPNFGTALLIVWHDIVEDTAQTDEKQCSTSLISSHRTYLISFCGSQSYRYLCKVDIHYN